MDLLRTIFSRNKFNAEVRQLDPPDTENPVGCIQYNLNLRLNLSTDHLSDKNNCLRPQHVGIQRPKPNATDILYNIR